MDDLPGGLEELGPFSRAVWEAAPGCDLLDETDLADEAAAMERRRAQDHRCALGCEEPAVIALVIRAMGGDGRRLPPVWADLCWASLTGLYAESGGGRPPG